MTDYMRGRKWMAHEQVKIAMARCLIAVADVEDPEQRCDAYIRAGYTDEEILEHDAECKRREMIRRSLFNLRERMRA